MFITGDYHQRIHPALNTTPIKKYEQGILGNKDIPGRGLPKRVEDEDRLQLDLMPAILRTIQEYGIEIDYIKYNAGVLTRFREETYPDNPRKKIKFIFKRDPRDISVVYFYDPELRMYFRVPYRNTSFPPISIWEYNKVKNRLKESGEKDIDEDLIFATYERMNKVREKAAEKTKAARRDMERRKHHQRITPPKTADDIDTTHKQTEQMNIQDSSEDIEIEPY